MASIKNTKKRKPDTEKIVGGLATALIFGVPLVVGFSHLLDDAYYTIQSNAPQIFSTIMLWVSIILCAYCLVRTFLAIVCNKFLPKIPMPQNKVLRLAILAILGVLVGIFSPVGVLIMWVVTCLLGLATYSFV